MEKPDILEAALAGKHGPEIQKKAEDAIKAAVDQIAQEIFGVLGPAQSAAFSGMGRKFADGGFVSPGRIAMFGNGDCEHIMRRPGLDQLANSFEWREVTADAAPIVIKGVIE